MRCTSATSIPTRPGLEVFKANGDTPNPAGIQLRNARPAHKSSACPRCKAAACQGPWRWTSILAIADWKCGATMRRSTGDASLARGAEDYRRVRHDPRTPRGGIATPRGCTTCTATRFPNSSRAPATWACGGWRSAQRTHEWSADYQMGLRPSGRGGAGRRRGLRLPVRQRDKSQSLPVCRHPGRLAEEVVAGTADGKELRIFSTTVPTEQRIYTLMHDPIYRLGVAWQNVGYNQPAHTGLYFGRRHASPPRPDIVTTRANPTRQRSLIAPPAPVETPFG